MNFDIVTTRRFEKEIKKLVKKFPSLKSEFGSLISDLNLNPSMGTSLGNDCYKIRIGISSKGKGKSGGARVITYLYLSGKTVYLLSIYDKSEKEDLRSGELKEMVQSLDLNS